MVVEETPAQDTASQDSGAQEASPAITDPVFLAGLGRILVQIEMRTCLPLSRGNRVSGSALRPRSGCCSSDLGLAAPP